MIDKTSVEKNIVVDILIKEYRVDIKNPKLKEYSLGSIDYKKYDKFEGKNRINIYDCINLKLKKMIICDVIPFEMLDEFYKKIKLNYKKYIKTTLFSFEYCDNQADFENDYNTYAYHKVISGILKDELQNIYFIDVGLYKMSEYFYGVTYEFCFKDEISILINEIYKDLDWCKVDAQKLDFCFRDKAYDTVISDLKYYLTDFVINNFITNTISRECSPFSLNVYEDNVLNIEAFDLLGYSGSVEQLEPKDEILFYSYKKSYNANYIVNPGILDKNNGKRDKIDFLTLLTIYNQYVYNYIIPLNLKYLKINSIKRSVKKSLDDINAFNKDYFYILRFLNNCNFEYARVYNNYVFFDPFGMIKSESLINEVAFKIKKINKEIEYIYNSLNNKYNFHRTCEDSKNTSNTLKVAIVTLIVSAIALIKPIDRFLPDRKDLDTNQDNLLNITKENSVDTYNLNYTIATAAEISSESVILVK